MSCLKNFMAVWKSKLGPPARPLGELELDLCLFASFDLDNTSEAEVQKLSLALERCSGAKKCSLAKVLVTIEGRVVTIGNHMKTSMVEFTTTWANDKGSKLDLDTAVKIARNAVVPGDSFFLAASV